MCRIFRTFQKSYFLRVHAATGRSKSTLSIAQSANIWDADNLDLDGLECAFWLGLRVFCITEIIIDLLTTPSKLLLYNKIMLVILRVRILTRYFIITLHDTPYSGGIIIMQESLSTLVLERWDAIVCGGGRANNIPEPQIKQKRPNSDLSRDKSSGYCSIQKPRFERYSDSDLRPL